MLYSRILLFIYLYLMSSMRSVVSDSPLSMRFPREEHWSGLPFPPPGHLPKPGVEITSLGSPAWAVTFSTTALPGKPPYLYIVVCNVNPKLLIFPSLLFLFGSRKFILYVCESVSVLQILISPFVSYFKFHI